MTIRLKFRKIRGREGLESLLFRPWENTEGWMQMGKTMEEKAFREHVSWVMFLLSILVIWAHSYNAELFSGGAPVTEGIWLTVHRIQDFLSAALGLTAVPGFFMLSAYLFFRSLSWEKLPAKWPFTGSLENRRCHLTGRSFWRLFFITSTRRYSGICIS